MQAAYIARRFGVFLLIVWLAGTLNFFLPRLSGQDPVRTKLLQQAALGGYVQGGIEEMTREYQQRFGLDKPLWHQYVTYLEGVARLDFNYSIANYPRTVRELIADETIINSNRRVVSFLPGSIFAFVRWASNDYGTVASRIDILRAITPGERYSTVPYVRPGAEILLRLAGWPRVEKVLQAIDAIEALGIDPADAAPEHWRHVHNRLSVNEVPRRYTQRRHQAWLHRRRVTL